MSTLVTCTFAGSGRVAIVSLFLFVGLPPLSPAQSPAATPPSGSQAVASLAAPDSPAAPPLTTTVDEVNLDLTIRTKHNKPILDLQPSQIAVTDDGSPVQLSSLRLVNANSGPEHLVSLVFDRLDPSASKMARKMAERILTAIPDKGYSFAVLQVNGRLRLLQPYTLDRRLVEEAVASATPVLPAPASTDLNPAEKALIASIHSDALTLDSANRAEGKMILSALEQSQQILEGRRGFPSLAALQALVLSDRLVTGRNLIVYFAGRTASSSDARDILHSILGMANRAGVTICVVNADPFNPEANSRMMSSMSSTLLGSGSGSGGNVSSFGVGNLPGSAPSSGFQPGGFGTAMVHNVSGFEFGDADTDESPLVPLAIGTGGIYVGDAAGLKHKLEQLHEELTSWYQASWVPPIKNYDGQFRPIRVSALRKDLVIRGRTGYFAVPPTETSGVRPFEVPLLNILSGAAAPTAIVFHAGILKLGELPDGNSGELAVQVPISQLEQHEDSNTHISSVHASIVAVIKDSKGAVLQRFGEDYPLHETPDMFRANAGQNITFQDHFSAQPGVYTLEAAVMDRIGNKAGVQRSTFTIEPQSKGAALSDITPVEEVEPTSEETGAFDPMRYQDGRVVPNLAAEMPEDTHSISLFFLLHPVAGSPNQPALRMQVLHNGQLVIDMPMELEKVSGSGAAIPYLATIRSRVFPPGTYQAKALLSQDGSTVSSVASFSVDGTLAASNVSDSTLPDAALSASGATSSGAIDPRLVSEAANGNSAFAITSSTNPMPPPSDAESQSLIEDARKRALSWTDTLANFSCFEITNHSIDTTGGGDWKKSDTLVELMKYVDHEESRTTLMLNGDQNSAAPDQFHFIHSAGEFGAMFHVVFDPSAKTAFAWKGYATLDGQPVDIFAFQVARANSSFDLSDRNNQTRPVGFHGALYIEPATRSVRRITIDADDIPNSLLVRASSMSIDYSWVSMQDHDFLLPVRGAVGMQETRRRAVLNEFEFRNYHRFGSQSHLVSDKELKALSNTPPLAANQ
jgi:VWFA-related protein